MRKEWSGWIKTRQWRAFEQEARSDPSQMLADTIGELLKGFDDKSDRRALKRILYFLEKAGYTPQEPDEDNQPPTDRAPFERAYMVSADAQGDTTVVYAYQRDRKVRWLLARINETLGVVGAKEEECAAEEAEAKAARYAESRVFPSVMAEVPAPFARWRLKRALALNRNGAPTTIAYWRSHLEQASEVPHPALELPRQAATEDDLRTTAVGMDPTLMWRLELGAATPLLRSLQEAHLDRAEISENDRRTRTDAIIDEARNEAFNEIAIQDHATRLLDLAYLLDRAGQAGSGLLMAAYDELRERGCDSQYARGVMDKTVVIYVETMRAAGDARTAKR
ncbi:MAG TPA: hypothetical protein VGE01_13700 [Fimbriimonas sp.]